MKPPSLEVNLFEINTTRKNKVWLITRGQSHKPKKNNDISKMIPTKITRLVKQLIYLNIQTQVWLTLLYW